MAPSQAIAIPEGNRWSEDRLFKLLFLAIGDIKTSYAELAEQWATRYPNEDFKPTARAIQEKFGALKKAFDVLPSGGPPRAKSTPTTPKKRSTPKACNTGSSSKRNKQFDAMDLDSDDDDDDGDIIKTPPPPRAKASVKSETRHTPSRRSKSATVDYRLLQSDTSDDNNEGVERRAGTPKARKEGDLGSLAARDGSAGMIKLDDGDIIINPRHIAGGSRKDSFAYFDQVDDDTDVSNFLPEED